MMKTSELIGPALDWAVAKCEGWCSETSIGMTIYHNPSVNWVQGGPIIERERIAICPYTVGDQWFAKVPDAGGGKWKNGPTPLIAAMRCYVAYKLGDIIEIPDELIFILQNAMS
jgi:hypothetical protein